MDDILLHAHMPSSLIERVLLVSGEAHTGNTMRLCHDYFRDMGAKDVRRATFFLQSGCTEAFEYYGFKSDQDVRLPWMFSSNYTRDSRSEAEAKKLASVQSPPQVPDCSAVPAPNRLGEIEKIPKAHPALVEGSRPADASAIRQFHVFLSHNSKDKPAVRQVGEALQARGLRVWLDEWELVPGRPWQEALEEIIQTTKSAAVLVGADGLGPWEIPEMRGCLSEFVDRKLPVIPVLLPGASRKPVLPMFLNQFTWVDLRDGLTKGGLDRLQWGITGTKP